MLQLPESRPYTTLVEGSTINILNFLGITPKVTSVSCVSCNHHIRFLPM